MTRKRVLIGAALTVAVAYVGVRVVRPKRPSVLRVVALAALSQLRFTWWTPTSYFKFIKGAASTSLADIDAFIRNSIHRAMAMFDEALHKTVSVIDDAISEVARGFSYLYGVAHSLVLQVAYIIGTAIPNAANWALHAAQTWALTGIQTVQRWAIDAFNNLISYAHAIENGLNWVVHTILPGVLSWINNAASWLGNWIATWWNYVWTHIIGPVFAKVEWLWTTVISWVKWLTDEAYGVVVTSIKAADWLIWFGEHTFSDLEQLITGEYNALSRSSILQAVHGTEQWFVQHEEAWARMLGATG